MRDVIELGGVRVHQADLVIVEAGAAGVMAALAANEQGATFVGMDQLPEFGGTAIVSGGGMSIAGSSLPRDQGIEDSPDRAYHDMVDGQTEADPAWVRFYYDHAASDLCGFAGGHISGVRSLEGIMIGASLFSGRVAGAWAANEAGFGPGFVGRPNRPELD